MWTEPNNQIELSASETFQIAGAAIGAVVMESKTLKAKIMPRIGCNPFMTRSTGARLPPKSKAPQSLAAPKGFNL
jgi:hypothetical protein